MLRAVLEILCACSKGALVYGVISLNPIVS